MYTIVKIVFKNANLTRANRNFRFFQVFTQHYNHSHMVRTMHKNQWVSLH